MFELNGKYNSAKIFTDIVDNESISQVMQLLNEPWSKGLCIRMMPDIHAGAGCTIGTTMTIKDKIVPNLVGVDIGCGMLTIGLQENDIDFATLDRVVHEQIPMGFDKRASVHSFMKDSDLLEGLYCKDHVDLDMAKLSVGTLGGGNHFIEVNVDDEGNHYLVIHTGSRHLGIDVCKYYQNQAVKQREQCDSVDIQALIQDYKKRGKETEIESAIRKVKSERVVVNKDLAYLDGYLMDKYIHDMKIAQAYAKTNRRAIANSILSEMGWHKVSEMDTIHNYIDTDNMILRKGSISAQEGEMCLIPMNMRDGSLICVGKGNQDWNFSAPHGAGRLMSRSQAKENISMDDFTKSMEGIYTSSVCESTLDESPMAYKKISDIIENVSDTVTIVKQIKPVYNCKAK